MIKRITEWIRHHQVQAFFILAYALTWPGFFLNYFIFPGNLFLEPLLAPIMFSPAITAMLISGVVEPQPKYASSGPRWFIFFLSWLFASTVLVLDFWKIQKINPEATIIIFSCIFSFLPAWVLSSAYARTPGIRKHFSTLLKPRGPVLWYLVIFLIFPGIQLLDMGLTYLFGGDIQFSLADLGFEGALIFPLIIFLRGFLISGGINEESGWRGFALPRLQARYPVIVSAGIVWFFWALWHLPYDIGEGVELAWILENRLLWNLIFSIFMTWLYNRTNGSILTPALFHTAMNTFGNNLPRTTISESLFISLAIFAFLTDRMWRKLPFDHPAIYRSP